MRERKKERSERKNVRITVKCFFRWHFLCVHSLATSLLARSFSSQCGCCFLSSFLLLYACCFQWFSLSLSHFRFGYFCIKKCIKSYVSQSIKELKQNRTYKAVSRTAMNETRNYFYVRQFFFCGVVVSAAPSPLLCADCGTITEWNFCMSVCHQQPINSHIISFTNPWDQADECFKQKKGWKLNQMSLELTACYWWLLQFCANTQTMPT